ncbi:SDR family oxidoreductase [Mucilaginibacter calamicampi]|uniref:SDR family oxidoreductase n=1 Tax=Mucilaginibacter calamicampi TaxID=1302352 RepID=A0ABW2YZ92_9SPHI
MKTIFITGTSSGLGKAAVELFHSKGWNVIATMRDVKKAKDFASLERVTVLPLDITNYEQIEAAVDTIISNFKIDVVLNNAAYGAVGPLESVSDDQLLKQVNTNLLGAIRVTKAFVPHFRENGGGLFINVTSIAGLTTFPFNSLYHAVKWGVEGWSEGMSYELAPFNIGIKTVAPGYIRTAFGENIAFISSEPYQEMMDHCMGAIKKMMDPATQGSTAAQIAGVIYTAATDGEDRVHYTAGADSAQMYERRLQIGAEASRKEMSGLFLGK